jgi:lipase chaperone LimK
MKKKSLIALSALCAAVVAFLASTFFLSGKDAPESVKSDGTCETFPIVGGPPGHINNPEGGYDSVFGDLPAKIRKKAVDGAFTVGRDGRLVVLPGVKSRFEYFLAGSDEEGMEKTESRIRENIEHSLPPKAAGEAKELLSNYLDYKKELLKICPGSFNLPQNPEQLEKLKEIDENRRELRKKYLTAETADALFGDEEIFDGFTLKRLSLFFDTSKNPKDKQLELQDLEKQMAAMIRERKKLEYALAHQEDINRQ